MNTVTQADIWQFVYEWGEKNVRDSRRLSILLSNSFNYEALLRP